MGAMVCGYGAQLFAARAVVPMIYLCVLNIEALFVYASEKLKPLLLRERSQEPWLPTQPGRRKGSSLISRPAAHDAVPQAALLAASLDSFTTRPRA